MIFENRVFTIIAVDGFSLDAADLDTNSLRFDNLTWKEAAPTFLLNMVFES